MKEVGLLSSLSMQALNASGSSKIARHLADIPKLGIAKCNSCLKSRPPRQAFKPSLPGWESAFPADASPGFFETRGTAPARRNWGRNCKRAGPSPRCDWEAWNEPRREGDQPRLGATCLKLTFE